MKQNNLIIRQQEIENRIYTIRGVQIMLDRDLAELYQTETRTLKQAVKRNVERFPEDFMLELSENEISQLVSQSVIPSKSYFGGAKPLAFTEQGVAMLSSVIKSPLAIKTSLRFIRAFVAMRKFILQNAQIFQRVDTLELKQLETDKKINRVLSALDNKQLQLEKGIFYNGQIFDAYTLISRLIRNADKTIILIDNYIDDTVFTLFTKRKKGVSVIIYTKNASKSLELDLKKYNSQFDPITIKKMNDAHDRFLIIDEKELYHIGASLKDLGKKWFAFSKMDSLCKEVLNRLSKNSRVSGESE